MINKFIKLNIKRKIILMSAVVIIPIIIIMSILTLKILNYNLLKSSIDSLLAESKSAQIYAQNIINENKEEDINIIIKDYSPFICNELKEMFDLRVQFFDNSGSLIYDTDNGKDISRYFDDIGEGVSGNKAYIVKKDEGIPYIFVSSPLFFKGEVCGAIRFVYKDIGTFNVVRNSFYVVLLVAMMFIILGIFLFNKLARKITTPLEELTDYSGEISKGNYDKKVNIKSGDEIEVLADTFNEMSENIKIYTSEIKKSYRNQKEFFDNISHEFRTPLTSIIGFSDIIPKLEKKAQIDESSMYIKKEGERLLDLVNEILAIAKNENEAFQIKNEFINIKTIIEEVEGLLSNRINNYHIVLEDNSIINFVYCDYNKTKQVFLNILDNAIKYSGCEVISISSEKFNDRYEVIIKDDGVGFDTDNPKSENSTGFGLKICKDIMQNQNGDFKIESEPYEGTVCRVIFYKHNKIKEKYEK